MDSFQRVKNWVRELRKIVGEDITICIAGNKSDLERNRHVSVEEADTCVRAAPLFTRARRGDSALPCRYAGAVGAQHFSTSAKTKKGVDDVFLALTKRAPTTVDLARCSARASGMTGCFCFCIRAEIVDRRKREESRGGGGRRKKQKSLLLVPDEPEPGQQGAGQGQAQPPSGGCC